MHGVRLTQARWCFLWSRQTGQINERIFGCHAHHRFAISFAKYFINHYIHQLNWIKGINDEQNKTENHLILTVTHFVLCLKRCRRRRRSRYRNQPAQSYIYFLASAMPCGRDTSPTFSVNYLSIYVCASENHHISAKWIRWPRATTPQSAQINVEFDDPIKITDLNIHK